MPWDPTLKARPTVYNGIRMRSRLEAGYAAWLDQQGFTWEYEPCAFSGKEGRQYLPDFRINDVLLLGVGRLCTVYVEVKPAGWMEGDADEELGAFSDLLRSMAVVLESEPDSLLLLEEPEPEDAQFARTSMLVWDGCVKLHWPRHVAWCNTKPLCECQRPPGLATPLMRTSGPWPKDWWKGQVG